MTGHARARSRVRPRPAAGHRDHHGRRQPFSVVAGRIFDFPFPGTSGSAEPTASSCSSCLSGFLIGSLLLDIVERKPDFRSWRIFMVRRWMRTIPLYVLWVAILFVLWPPARRLDWARPFLSDFHAEPGLANSRSGSASRGRFRSKSGSICCSVECFSRSRRSTGGKRSRSPARRSSWFPPCCGLRSELTDGDLDATLRKVVIFRLDAIAYGVVAVWFCRHWPSVVRRWKALAVAVGIVLVALTYVAGQSYWPITLSVAPLGLALLLPGAAALGSAPAIVEVPIRGSASAPTRRTWST